MKNDLIQRILDKSNDGLDIVLMVCPQAGEALEKRKQFKLRTSEKTASASIKRMDNGGYWIKDFGSDFSGGPIQLYCHLTGRDFKTALKELGSQYQVLDDGGSFTPIKPIYEKAPAGELDKPGDYNIELRDEFTQFELETIFSKNTVSYAFNIYKDDWKKHLAKVCALYACAAVVSYSYVKDGERRTTKSTEEYPIFCFTGTDKEGKDFKKIYQPLAEKKFRFRTFGTQDKDFIWGYARAIKTHNDLVAKWHSENQSEEQNEEDGGKKKYKEPKLEDIIICSGNGDALNTAALGYNVIWQNSETAIMPDKTYAELRKRAESVYNLPDLDSTGLLQAHKLALRFLDLKTIYLPTELRLKRDRRGNPCKDQRDFLNHYYKRDFDHLVKSAVEYKFWDEEAQFDREGNFKKNNYVFNNVRAYNFITRNGFHRIRSKTNKAGYEYIQVKNNVVKIVDVREIKAFINQFLEERFTDDQRLRNTFYRMNQLKDESLDNLKYVEPDFKYYAYDHQFLFFVNSAWKVSATEIEHYLPGEIAKMVWDDKVVPHQVKLLEAPFTISTIQHPDGSPDLDIVVNNNDCLFLNYLINTSRIHWRKELESECEAKYSSAEEIDKYRTEHKFDIAGPLLTNEERSEQKKHLINKLYVLGYLMARHKEKSKPWAPFLMDHKLSAEGESHGGSGKTIFARSLEHFMNFLLLDGKSKTLADDKHAFENVTEQTEVILIDDLSRHLNIEAFFSMITEGMTVNPKYTQRFIIPYETAPKIIFSSNFGVKDITPSAERRIIYAAFGDYYHNNSTGNYKEDRTPKNDFGKDLFSGFDEKEWNAFCNTMARCLQFYLSYPHKINPPMDNVLRRNLQGIMGDGFISWADVYFSNENNRLDTIVAKLEAFNDYAKSTNDKYTKPTGFGHKVEAWCRYNKYQFNPAELRNSGGRIIRKWPEKRADGSVVMEIKTGADGNSKQIVKMKATEMIYIKTLDEAIDLEKMKDVPEVEEETTGIFMASPGDDGDPFK